jgi:hypothetical protein
VTADNAASVKCPGCELELPEDDIRAQIAHMNAAHPDLVAKRQAEAARWDGWEDK